jgi:hypothetical protein
MRSKLNAQEIAARRAVLILLLVFCAIVGAIALYGWIGATSATSPRPNMPPLP